MRTLEKLEFLMKIRSVVADTRGPFLSQIDKAEATVKACMRHGIVQGPIADREANPVLQFVSYFTHESCGSDKSCSDKRLDYSILEEEAWTHFNDQQQIAQVKPTM